MGVIHSLYNNIHNITRILDSNVPIIQENEKDAFNAFISHYITPKTINGLLEFTCQYKIDNMLPFIIEHSKPTLAKYNILDYDKHKLNMPYFLTKRMDIYAICVLGLEEWLHFYFKILQSSDKQQYIDQADIEDRDYYQFIFDNYVNINSILLMTCIEHNNFECLKILIKYKCPSNEHVIAVAAKHGRYNMMRYLRFCGHTVSILAIQYATIYNRTKCLNYAIKHYH
jgi:hypothetical protein